MQILDCRYQMVAPICGTIVRQECPPSLFTGARAKMSAMLSLASISIGIVSAVARRRYPGFNFSKELRNAKLTWNDATLNNYLVNPDALVPGTSMSTQVTDAGERKDSIACLRTTVGPAIQPAQTNKPTPASTLDSNR